MRKDRISAIRTYRQMENKAAQALDERQQESPAVGCVRVRGWLEHADILAET